MGWSQSAMCEPCKSFFLVGGPPPRLGGLLVNLWSKVNRHATEPYRYATTSYRRYPLSRLKSCFCRMHISATPPSFLSSFSSSRNSICTLPDWWATPRPRTLQVALSSLDVPRVSHRYRGYQGKPTQSISTDTHVSTARPTGEIYNRVRPFGAKAA